jgi:hypothetical protein
MTAFEESEPFESGAGPRRTDSGHVFVFQEASRPLGLGVFFVFCRRTKATRDRVADWRRCSR